MFSSPCQGQTIHLSSLGDPTRTKRSIPDVTSLPCRTLAGSRVAAKISSNSKNSFWNKKYRAVFPHQEHSPGCHHDHQDILLPHHAPEVTIGVFQRSCGDKN